ncbi:melanophilin isoform X2 [Gambusia affinis]|uniref:melanophilin isoform X2 n=1 Tax=Gambusia affinis TaxID=33528 RepID=UPI001CDC4E13|nr:melanophilin isoform X2 [Gambusia affinis]
MPTTTVGRKLDLSKLTDEEARHVWEVVQRDFDLRKKEEDRLGELKSKIEKDDAKRELLGSRSSLAESYCIRCLQPFRFLLNVKRQCLDCQLHVCRSCSRFSRREQGWLCESCHLARVLKIGTLEWYHQNVRARFKRFGSAKVMRSLFKRLSGEHSRSHGDPTEHPEFDTCSEPEHHSESMFSCGFIKTRLFQPGVYEDLSLDVSDSPVLQKAKRRLTVDPVDFVLGFDYSADSRPRDDQVADQTPVLPVSGVLDAGDPTLAGADMEDDFHQNLQQDNRSLDLEMHSQHDEMVFAETRTVPSRSVSRLSYSSCGSGSIILRGGSSFLPSLDDSEAEDDLCPRVPAYLSHPDPGCHTSQESLSSAGAAPQIGDLNKRMSAIETLLSCLEQKVTPANRKDIRTAQSPSPPRLPQWDEEELEEQQLRLKLQQLTHNISDQSLSSEEDEAGGTRTRTRTGLEEDLKAGRLTLSPDTKQRPPLEPPRTASRGSASLLLELEDRVAQAAAEVQSAQSQVSYIEDRIAALSTAGGPVDRRRMSAIPVRTRRLSHNLPSRSGADSGLMKRRLSIM